MHDSSTKKYRLQADWFTHVIPSWQELFQRIGWNPSTPKTIVEIGCFEGRATVWMLENLVASPASQMYCIDRFAADPGTLQWDFDQVRANFLHNVRLTGKADLVHLREGPSFPELTSLYAEGLRADFIYIDGSHHARDVLADLVMSFEIAKPGALVICDDYLWQQESDAKVDVLNNPKFAIDSFVNVYMRELQICSKVPLYQLAFLKMAPPFTN